jgi:peptidoglycan/LPS O-acetylase OafA/YrhL
MANRVRMSKSNNFDLIRLFAALQVATTHSLQHLNVVVPWAFVRDFLQLFPGVPIFFFVSGFLISKSYDRNPSLRDFSLNRCLRIYPALIVCLVVSVISVIFTGYFRSVTVKTTEFAAWVAAQLTFGQFYNPPFLRHYGVGVLNGSVWTICVELQFYVLTPAIHHLCRAACKTKYAGNLFFLGLIGGFLVANRLYFSPHMSTHGASIAYKLLGVTFIPWFYMFLAGAFAQRNFDFFHAILSRRFVVAFPMYFAFAVAAGIYGRLRLGNELSPILFVALIAAVFAAAFSRQELSDRLLKRNDISYGVYIYHMPIINFALAMGYAESFKVFCAAVSATAAMALASWFVIEKPVLNLKNRPLYSHSTH